MATLQNLDAQLAFERVSAIFRAERRRFASDEGLKLVQLEALLYLYRANRYSNTPAALSEYLGLTKGTVSQTIGALVRHGLVEKQPDQHDGRRTRVALTREGRAMARRAFPAASLEGLPADALESLVRHLQREHGYRTFGACGSCRLHERQGSARRCGLTGERLSDADSRRLCREHEARP